MDTVKRVENLISERHMTMYELTRSSGIAYSTISTAKRRGGQLTIDTIERICDALHMNLCDFFAEEPRKYPAMQSTPVEADQQWSVQPC